MLAVGLAACAGETIPKQYLKQAEPDVTLTRLSRQPAAYEGKVVILGGVIVDEKSGDNRIWLRVKNRPLDVDYVPHIPITNEGPEAGYYWVMVWKRDLPKDYQQWARMTVVGRVMRGQEAQDKSATDEGVVLTALYLKGWDKRLGGYGMREEEGSSVGRAPAPPRPVQKNSSVY